jgi:hypothetical protein
MVLASSRIRSNVARHAVSRLMEFCSQRELQNQTGHSVYEWTLVATCPSRWSAMIFRPGA